ncbi:hypothetical protein KOR42_36490 [Thalassoglobus neptunius]|uniref:Uncharacterized protein n=1 Tax=Thalassoglobus neptunius TaxID=1938619 RepID=A0A5C5WJS5_9PLAN|nr:hypothetical protein [Thalassoglobus neptunius]TWT50102.1 hypothetical protein KOR42_36490 [Thalassoglobus neptunius]
MMDRKIVVHESQSLLTAHLERSFIDDSSIQVKWTPHRIDFLQESQVEETRLAILNRVEISEGLMQELFNIARLTNVCCILRREDEHQEELLREIGVVSVMNEAFAEKFLLSTVTRLISDEMIGP